LIVSGTTNLLNTTTINSSLNVLSYSLLNNYVSINSSLFVSGTTNLLNTTTINSSLNVLSYSLLNNYVSINSSLFVSGTTNLLNITTINSSLNVYGGCILNNTTINSSLVINGDLNITGHITISNNLLFDLVNTQMGSVCTSLSEVHTVNYSSKFVNTPHLIAYPYNIYNNGTGVSNIDGCIKSVSNTGFKIHPPNNNNNNNISIISILWVAMAKNPNLPSFIY
jgi:hypothetical protein